MNVKMKTMVALLCMVFLLGSSSLDKVFTLKYFADDDHTSLAYQPVASEAYSESNSDSELFMDSNKTHFLPNENVVFSYSVSSGENIVDFTYSGNGFNIISVELDEDIESRIVVELSCISNLDEYTFDIFVSLEDGQEVVASLFAIKNDYGVFISEVSLDNARERCYKYAIENDILTEEQAANLFMESYKGTAEESVTVEYTTTNMSTNVSTMSAGSETRIYCGYLQWLDDNNVSHPLRKVQVEIYKNIGIIPILLDTTNTNDDGYFEFSIPVETDTFLKIFAGDSNAMVKTGLLGAEYYYESDLSYGAPVGVVSTYHSTFSMDNDLGKAFQISQAVLTARDYAWAMMGEMPTDVSVVYPYDGEIEDTHDPSNTNGCSYNNLLKTIKITGRHPVDHSYPHSYASWDVIMHEYGHHIQHEFEIIDHPGGKHDSSQNNADVRGNKDEGIRLAWAESWPTVFSLMAQQYFQIHLLDIDTVANSSYTAYNEVNYNIETTSIRLGEACERSIMAVLWDLYDNVNDEYDTISLGHAEWWNATTKNINNLKSKSKTFSDFINHFYEKYPEYIDDIAENLTYYGMAATMPRMTNASSISETLPPNFSWDAQGGSSTCPNNSFVLIFYDEDGSEIFRTDDMPESEYTLTQNEWNLVINSAGDSYTVAVASNQTHEPVTGSYISRKSITYYKSNIHMHSYTDHHGEQTETEHVAYCECGEYIIQNHHFSYTNITDTHHTTACVCGQVGETEEHYSYSYSRYDTLKHRVYCECGHYIGISYHVVNAGGGFFKICIRCGERIDMGEVILPVPGPNSQSTSRITYITEAGSYVDSDGIIYLVESDMELYLAGELDVYALAQNALGTVTH